MAVIRSGVLGRLSGKVASVVGGTWKGINYVREKVKPANPNTPLQQAQRSNMRFVVAWVRSLIALVLIPYVNRFVRRKSGYNFVVQRNIMNFEGITQISNIPNSTTTLPSLSSDNRFALTTGTLRAPSTTGSTYTSGAFSIAGNQSDGVTLMSTDVQYVVVSDLSGNVAPVVKSAAIGSSPAAIAVSSGELGVFATGTKLAVFTFLVRHTQNDTTRGIEACSPSISTVLTKT